MGDEELSPEAQNVLMEVFRSYDKSRDDSLSSDELMRALPFAGIYVTKEGARELLTLFDKNGNADGKLGIKELVDNWKVMAQHSVNGDELLDSFKMFDKNCDGYIQESELKAVLMKAGDKWSREEAQKAIRDLGRFDKHQDGKFSYMEFVEMFQQDAFPFKRPEAVERSDVTQEYEKPTESQQQQQQQQELDGGGVKVAESRQEPAAAEAQEAQ